MITPKSHFQFRFHADIISKMKNKGTAKLIIIFGAVHIPFRYSISKARNDKLENYLSQVQETKTYL